MPHWTLLFSILAATCASYHPEPLTPASLDAALKPPPLPEVRALASALRHPLLPPISFDPGDGLSPDEAAVLAVIANPDLKARRDRRGIAQAQVLEAGLLPNPVLSYNLDAPVGGIREGKVTAFGAGLEWEVSRMLPRNARKQAAREHAAAVDLEIAWQEWQVAQAARLHATRLSWLDRQQQLADRRSQVLDREKKLLRHAVEAGEATSLELATVEKASGAALQEATALRGQRNTESLALVRAIGFPPTASVSLQAPANGSPESIPRLDELLSGLEDRRLDLVALRLGYASQEARLRAAVRAQFPRLDIGLTGGRDSDRLQTAGFEIRVALPLFDRNQGSIAAASATRKQLFDEYAARLFAARADVAEFRSRWTAAADQVRNLEAVLPVLRRQSAACMRSEDRGGETRAGCLSLIEAALDAEGQLLGQQRLQAELAIGVDLVAGAWHGQAPARRFSKR